jgi:hypothetical protein
MVRKTRIVMALKQVQMVLRGAPRCRDASPAERLSVYHVGIAYHALVRSMPFPDDINVICVFWKMTGIRSFAILARLERRLEEATISGRIQ